MILDKLKGKPGLVMEVERVEETNTYTAWIHSISNGEIVESMAKKGFRSETEAKNEGMKAVEQITKALRDGGFKINVVMKRSENSNVGVVH